MFFIFYLKSPKMQLTLVALDIKEDLFSLWKSGWRDIKIQRRWRIAKKKIEALYLEKRKSGYCCII